MTDKLFIDVGLFETRVASVTADRITDYTLYSDINSSRVGEVYLGRVSSLAKGLDAVFVDLGQVGDGLLLSRDVPLAGGIQKTAAVSEKLVEGQKICVQVIKDRTADKLPQLSAFIQLEGLHVVFKPQASGVNISKKIKDADLKTELTTDLQNRLSATGGGVTVRSSAQKEELASLGAELTNLISQWDDLNAAIARDQKPRCLIPADPPSVDAYKKYAGDETEILINDRLAFQQLTKFLKSTNKDGKAVTLWTDPALLFDAFGLEEQVAATGDMRVSLPSGGNITIERTEALVVIDVNSGSMTETSGMQSIALKTNLEAAVALCAQIRLRNLSGIIIVDFIQMQEKGAKEELTKCLEKHTRDDLSAVRIIGMTELGLMQLTRQRKGAPLSELLSAPLGPEAGAVPVRVASNLVRDIRRYSTDHKTPKIRVKTGTRLTSFLKQQSADIENAYGLTILHEEDATLHGYKYQLG